MMRPQFIRFQATVSARREAAGYLKAPGDAVLIQRGRPRWLLLSCPCGCGEEFPINLDPRAGPAWRLYGNVQSQLTVFPSVWRESGCKSHYVVWRSRIYLFSRFGDEFENAEEPNEIALLTEAVRGRLRKNSFLPFAEIAESLNAVPWDVLMVCRGLTRKGIAREGKNNQRGSFGLV
jgi:Family of unknown function (DUF6527)